MTNIYFKVRLEELEQDCDDFDIDAFDDLNDHTNYIHSLMLMKFDGEASCCRLRILARTS